MHSTSLLNLLDNHQGYLGEDHYTYVDKGNIVSIPYTKLPYPYNQLDLIKKSKYYKLIQENTILIFRDGDDGFPSIFDVSIKTLYKTSNLVNNPNPWVWLNYNSQYPYSRLKKTKNRILKR